MAFCSHSSKCTEPRLHTVEHFPSRSHLHQTRLRFHGVKVTRCCSFSLNPHQSMAVQLVAGGTPLRDSQCKLLDELSWGKRRLAPASRLTFKLLRAKQLAGWSVTCF